LSQNVTTLGYLHVLNVLLKLEVGDYLMDDGPVSLDVKIKVVQKEICQLDFVV
jgi:hypothetical protein